MEETTKEHGLTEEEEEEMNVPGSFHSSSSKRHEAKVEADKDAGKEEKEEEVGYVGGFMRRLGLS